MSERSVPSKRRSPGRSWEHRLLPRVRGYIAWPIEQFSLSSLQRDMPRCSTLVRSTVDDSASDSSSLCTLEIMASPKQVRKCRSSVFHVAACRHLPVTSLVSYLCLRSSRINVQAYLWVLFMISMAGLRSKLSESLGSTRGSS